MSATDEMITQQTGPNQVIHIRQDSTQELDDLFTKSLSQSSSYKGRNLPESWYNPPHSRENSIDNTQHNPASQNSSFLPVHNRIKSCPEMMEDPSTARPKPHHIRSPSLDTILDEHIPLPAGWEVAYTPDGKRYYIEWVYLLKFLLTECICSLL